MLLTTADEQRETQSVICYDRGSGKVVWSTDVHRGKLDRKGNKKTTQASASVACDGKRLFVNFLNDGAVRTSALDFDGKILWTTKVSDFVTHQGFGSSPAVYRGLVIVSADNRGGGIVAALDRQTGDVVWSEKRPAKDNYTSPVVLSIDGKDQLLLSGCDLASAYDPLSGAKLWETAGATTECVTTMVTDGRLVFVSGGYPRNHTEAIVADGSARVAWQNNTRVYVPSMLVHEGYLYAVTDAGAAVCWKSDSGAEKWKSPLGRHVRRFAGASRPALVRHQRVGQDIRLQGRSRQVRAGGRKPIGRRGLRHAHDLRQSDLPPRRRAIASARQEMLYCLGGPESASTK